VRGKLFSSPPMVVDHVLHLCPCRPEYQARKHGEGPQLRRLKAEPRGFRQATDQCHHCVAVPGSAACRLCRPGPGLDCARHFAAAASHCTWLLGLAPTQNPYQCVVAWFACAPLGLCLEATVNQGLCNISFSWMTTTLLVLLKHGEHDPCSLSHLHLYRFCGSAQYSTTIVHFLCEPGHKLEKGHCFEYQGSECPNSCSTKKFHPAPKAFALQTHPTAKKSNALAHIFSRATASSSNWVGGN
jgi:hypothetical protein